VSAPHERISREEDGRAAAPRVLLVDDNPDDRALVRRVLTQALGAHDACEVLDEPSLAAALAEGAPDLVVTDYQLGWSTGRTVLERVKAAHPEAPVVMFTGSGNEQLAADLVVAGLDDYVVKSPKYRMRLETAVRAAVGQRRALQGMRTAQSRLAHVLERLGVGLFRCTADGRLLEANGAFRELLDLPPDGAGERLPFLVCSDATRHRWQARHTGAREYIECEHEHVAADGTIRYLWITETVTSGTGGAGDEIEGLLEDVTDRRRLEAQLLQAQKMEAVGLLAGGIAHDFNNLLTAIIGGVALMRRRLRDQPALDREARDVEAASMRAADLTSQLLAFSRRQPLRPRAVDPNAAVHGVERLLRRVLGEHIRIELRLGDDARPVYVDPGQLEQLLVNLAINARDAMPHGGTLLLETGNATLDASYAALRPEVRPGAYGFVAVTDTGHGMSPEVQARIFEPFFTTKGPGQGTGLGLATVYGVVKQSGGHVGVYSEPGRGTTFRVYLPMAKEAPSADVAAPAAAAPRSTGRILLVEDDEAVRSIARRSLEESGFEVVDAPHPAAALTVLSRGGPPYDVLITDVVMPGMSGPELAQRLRAEMPGLLVIFMSGYPASAVASHGVRAPGEHFVTKPFTPDALVERVTELLRRGRTEG
jgi:signal transduction histidine kinase